MDSYLNWLENFAHNERYIGSTPMLSTKFHKDMWPVSSSVVEHLPVKRGTPIQLWTGGPDILNNN